MKQFLRYSEIYLDRFSFSMYFRRVLLVGLAYALSLFFVISVYPGTVYSQSLEHRFWCESDLYLGSHSLPADGNSHSGHDQGQCCLAQTSSPDLAEPADIMPLIRELIFRIVAATGPQVERPAPINVAIYFQSRAPPTYVG